MYGDWLLDIAWLNFWQPWYPAWVSIDFLAEAKSYFRIGADFDWRIPACQLLIGLGEQVYCAWRGRSRYPQLVSRPRSS
jgi:hygromycin-B 4-O-kinase